MKHDLKQLLQRWEDGTLTEEALRQLADALESPEARARLRSEWFLDSALPQALQSAPLWGAKHPQPIRRISILERITIPSWTPAHWAAVGAAAVVCVACLIWERSNPRSEDLEAFAAQLTASTLEP